MTITLIVFVVISYIFIGVLVEEFCGIHEYIKILPEESFCDKEYLEEMSIYHEENINYRVIVSWPVYLSLFILGVIIIGAFYFIKRFL